jgi:FkbH-like protein
MLSEKEKTRIEYFEDLFKKSDLKLMNGNELLSHASKFSRIEEQYLNRNSKSLYPQKIAVLASYTSHHFIQVLKLFLYQRGIAPQFYEGEYDSIAMDLMDKKSGLFQFRPNIILILTHYTDLKDFPKLFSDSATVDRWIEQKTVFYHKLWENAASIPGCQIYQTNFVLPLYRPLGNLEINYPFTPRIALERLNIALMLHKPSNVFLFDMDYLAAYFGKRKWFDDSTYFLSKQGFAFDAFGLVAQAFSRVLSANIGKIRKCLVLDLDNTLWGGVIGDDGLEGINLNPSHAVGEAFITFQQYLKKLKDRGVILAVCSKNDEQSAKLPFQKHPDMVLSIDDISCFVANWNDKPSNIKSIASSLNIGLDSMVFFDDNPFERDIIRQFIPEIEIIDVPSDPTYYIDALDKAMCFEWSQLSSEDTTRTESYVCDRKRQELVLETGDYDSYLKALDMKITLGYVTALEESRFTQLINKTNQFNLRTKRYTESAISQMMHDHERFALIHVSLEDKFSKYGIISCIILERKEAIAFIDTWVMSCRVLKRGVENVVFQKICKTARSWDCKWVIGEYIPTKKNEMVAGLYETFGFEKVNREVPIDFPKTDENGVIYRMNPVDCDKIFLSCAIDKVEEE